MSLRFLDFITGKHNLLDLHSMTKYQVKQVTCSTNLYNIHGSKPEEILVRLQLLDVFPQWSFRVHTGTILCTTEDVHTAQCLQSNSIMTIANHTWHHLVWFSNTHFFVHWWRYMTLSSCIITSVLLCHDEQVPAFIILYHFIHIVQKISFSI